MSKLIYVDDRNQHVVINDDVSDEEILALVEAKDSLVKVMNSIDYYNIVKDNIVELMQGIINFDFIKEKAFAIINRYFFNMVSSFYSYTKYFERFFENRYKTIFSEQYDAYETYKLITEMRKYTTHCYVAITKATRDIITGEISIQIVPSDILANDENIKRDVKQILTHYKEKGEAIDLKKLTGDFLNIFCELQVKIMNKMQDEIFANIDVLEQYVYRGNFKLRDTYLLMDDGSIINVSNILCLLVKKFQEEYVPNNTIEVLSEMYGVDTNSN